MKSIPLLRPLCVFLACAFAVTAHAVPISYSFSGTLDSMAWGNGLPRPFGGESPLGETASGSFTFDADYANNESTDPARLFLRAASSAFASFDISVTNFAPLSSFASGGGNCVSPYSTLIISDNHPNTGFPPSPGRVTDEWVLSAWCTEQIAPGIEVTRSFLFEFNDWNPWESPDLTSGLDPTQLLDWTLATTSFISFGYSLTDANCATCMYGVREGWSVGIDLDSLTASANVPEPATSSLLMLGLAGCLLGRRRRSV